MKTGLHKDEDILQQFGRMLDKEKISTNDVLTDARWKELFAKYGGALESMWVRLTMQYSHFPLVSDKFLIKNKKARRIVPRGTFKRRGISLLMQQELIEPYLERNKYYDIGYVHELCEQIAYAIVGCGPLSYLKTYFTEFHSDRLCFTLKKGQVAFHKYKHYYPGTTVKKFSVLEVEDAITEAISIGDIVVDDVKTQSEWRQYFKDAEGYNPKLACGLSIMLNRQSFKYALMLRPLDGQKTWRFVEMHNVLPIEIGIEELIDAKFLSVGQEFSSKKEIYKIMREADPSGERFARLDFKLKHVTANTPIKLGQYALVPIPTGFVLRKSG